MNVLANRNYARSYYQKRMMYSEDKKGEYNSATMINYCVDGICFEADKALNPGFAVCIKLLNNSPDSEYSPEAYKIFNGKVKWCKELDDPSRYGIGVQFCKTLNQKPC
ncbi:MAG: hypothetical protein R6X10_04800 [Desulfobacterales bacterium]